MPCHEPHAVKVAGFNPEGWSVYFIEFLQGFNELYHSPSLPLRPYFTPVKGIPGSQDSDEAHFLGFQTPRPPSSPSLSVSLLQPSVFCPLALGEGESPGL